MTAQDLARLERIKAACCPFSVVDVNAHALAIFGTLVDLSAVPFKNAER